MIDENVLKTLNIFKSSEILKIIHSRDEEYNTASISLKNEINQGRIIILLGYQGLSADEIINLNVKNIEINENTINIPESSKKFLIKSPLTNYLTDYLSYQNIDSDLEDNPLFIGIDGNRITEYRIQNVITSFKNHAKIFKKISIEILNNSRKYNRKENITNQENVDINSEDIVNSAEDVNNSDDTIVIHVNDSDTDDFNKVDTTIEDTVMSADNKIKNKPTNNSEIVNNDYFSTKAKQELTDFINYQTHINQKQNAKIEEYDKIISDLSEKNSNILNLTQIFKENMEKQNEIINEMNDTISILKENNEKLNQQINQITEKNKEKSTTNEIDIITNNETEPINNNEIKSTVTVEKIINNWIKENIKITNYHNDLIQLKEISSIIKKLLTEKSISYNEKQIDTLIIREIKLYYDEGSVNKKKFLEINNGKTYFLGFKFNILPENKQPKKILDYNKTCTDIIEEWINKNIEITDNYEDILEYNDIDKKVNTVLNTYQISYKEKVNIQKYIDNTIRKLHGNYKSNKVRFFKQVKEDNIIYRGFKYINE